MKPRRKYQGEETHKIALEEQHKNFVLVRRHLKKAKKRQAKYADQGSKQIDYEVGDPVYYKNQRMQNKLDARWKPFHRIIAKRGPSSYLIQNQLDGSTIKAHAIDLNPVNLEEWDIPCTKDGISMRKAAYAIPPDESSSEEDDSEPEEPLKKVIRRHRREREDSDEEDDIPLMELSKRLKARKEAEEQEIREAEEQRQYLERDQQVQEPEPIDETMGEEDEPMGEDAFDDAISVNDVNDCTPSDTESKRVNCPEKIESENKAKENKTDLKVKAEALVQAHRAFLSIMSGLA